MIRGNVVKTSPTDERNLYFNSPNLLNNYLISGLAKVGQIVRTLNIQGGYDLKVIINDGSGGLTTRDLVDKSKLQETQTMNIPPSTSTIGKGGDIVEVDGVLYECFGQKNNNYIWKKVSFDGGGSGSSSQIVSGEVDANGHITFTDSDGNVFTTTGKSVIGVDGADWVPTAAEKTAIATEAAGMVNVPTKTSDLTNDSGFLTAHQDVSGKENTSNKKTSISNQSQTGDSDTFYPTVGAVRDFVNFVKDDLEDYVDEEIGNIETLLSQV